MAWFLGSAIIGILYGISLFWTIGVSMALQLAALPFLFLAVRKLHRPIAP